MPKRVRTAKKTRISKRAARNPNGQLFSGEAGYLGEQSSANPQRTTPQAIAQLQRQVGNRAVNGVIAGMPGKQSWTMQTMPLQRQMEDEGQTGAAPFEPVALEEEPEMATMETPATNEWGEFDGLLTSDVVPHAFSNRGKTGSAIAHWAGGTGGRGNQGVGTIDVVAPQYDSEAPIPGDPDHTTAWAWIRPGTGTARVTRSFTGVTPGANNTFYVTTRASIRMDTHERLHVRSSRTIHNTNITPLEARVRANRGRNRALRTGATTADAIAALRTLVDWNTAITAFQTADTTENTPGGTVDTTDAATANFYFDYGPRTVRRVAYAHYIDIPPGP